MTKTSRNDPCPCGSGKKYKKCCVNEAVVPQAAQSTPKRGMFRKQKSTIPIKTKAEIEGIRRAGALTSKVLTLLNDVVKAGATTNDVNDFVHQFTLDNNAKPAPLNYRGFPKSVCTSLNDVICHGIPSQTKLKEGDILNVDVTCILDGFYGDSCRMYYVGQPSDDARRLVDVTRECLDLGMQTVKPGGHFGDIGYAIQQHAEKAGFSVVREYTGHGIGTAFHEEPQILHYGRQGHGEAFAPGMVFTIEPMINAGQWQSELLADNWTAVTADGSLSAQWEHTIAVTDDGFDILTAY